MVTCTAGYEENPPDLTGFRVDSTYIVTYSGEINQGTATEISKQPILEVLADGYELSENNTLIKGDIDFSKVDESKGKWYDYAEQKWANIVVRNNGNEAYFVWIPRYAYIANNETQTTDIVFIDTDNIQPKTGKEVDTNRYTIPEAFTWQDDAGNTIQLPGYWIGKYQLSSFETFGLTADVYNGVNLIRLTNIRNNVVSNNNARYEITLKKDGEVIKKVENANADLCEFSETTGTKLEGGIYEILIVLYDEREYYRGEITLTADVYEQTNQETQPNSPDLTGFRVDTTYIVTYSGEIDKGTATETSNQPISEILKEGYKVNADNTLKEGEIDFSKIKGEWYNYAEQKWANIVVRNEGNEAYFVWIPRYEYHAYGTQQVTDVYFISTKQDKANYGYTIPEAFTWQDDAGNTIQLPGYWIGKYQLSSFETFGLTADVYNGVNLIRLTNIRNNVVSNNNARYEITLKKDGEVIKKVENANADLCEFSENTGTKLEGGEYEILIVVYDERGYYRGETTLTAEVYVQNNIDREPNPPDLTGFNRSITYYVTYDGDGNEVLTPLAQGEPDGWYNYAEQKWANIVVKNEDVEKTAYFVWIPRYEYHAYGTQEVTDVYFIPTTQIEPTYGYTIPEAFTWEDEEGNIVQLSGYWIGKYQLSN